MSVAASFKTIFEVAQKKGYIQCFGHATYSNHQKKKDIIKTSNPILLGYLQTYFLNP